MTTYVGVYVQTHLLTSALVGGDWSSHSGRSNPGKEPSISLDMRLDESQKLSV
jgi:hypothetical protein